jgi:hypothetical protein
MNRSIRGIAFVALAGIVLASTSAFAQQRTYRDCDAEWKADKAAIKASGMTKKAFVAQCHGSATVETPSQSTTRSQPTSQPTTVPYTPPRQTTTPYTPPRQTTTTTTTNEPYAPSRRTYVPTSAPTGGGQYATEMAARIHCPADTVVWANLNSKVYHFNGNRDYGTTKHGAYMCERETAGFRAAKNEKHP